ncbi:MAG: SPOR domain-containing protein [bacterium]|nr:SPOR domain-containing protein [bacterium]
MCAVDRGIVVTIQDSIITNFEAPGIVSGAFLVSNLDTIPHELTEVIEVPTDWHLISGSGSFKLSPGAQEVRVVAAVVKGQTPPGEYHITYTAHEKDERYSANQQVLTVQVKPIISVELSVVEAPLFVEAGTPYRVTFSIEHKGNESATVDLVAKSSAGFQVALDSNKLELAPQQTRLLSAEVLSPRNLTRPVKDRLFIRATAGHDTLVSGTQTYSVVNIVPASARTEAKYRQLPSRFTTRYVGGDGKDGVQFEFAGAGPLDDHDHHIEYRFRGPERFENNAFGLRDEVYLKLRADDVSISAGDQNFALSNLLERGRLGRGVEVDVDKGNVEARAISFQSRAQIPDYEGLGGYIGYSLGRRFSLRGNTLIKKTTRTDDELFSVSSSFEPARQWKVNLESATGTKGHGNADPPLAFWSRIDGRVSTTQISLQKHIANREFHGQIQDIDQNLVDLFTSLPYGFGWANAYRDFSENLEKSGSVPTAPREKHFRTGLNFRNFSLANASLDFETHTRVDKLTSPEFDNRVSFLVARLQKSFRTVGLSSTVMRGVRKDYLTGQSSDLENYRLSVDAHPIRGQRCEGWWQTGHSGYSIDAKRSNIIGFNAEYNTINSLLLNASFQIVDRNDDHDFESLQYDVGVQYEPYKNHFITLKLRKRDFDELQFDHETSYMLSYQLPVGIPIGRKRDQGSLQGRIYDIDNPTAGGIPGALLRVGDRTTLSDKNGKFVFHSLSRGVHYLQIENAAFGLDRVPMERMPIELNIVGARTESIDLKIAKSCTISGNVSVYGHRDENTERGILVESGTADSLAQRTRELQPLRGLADCNLALSNGDEMITATTASDGSFAVRKLRPGVWTVTMRTTNLPDYHRLEQETYTVTLNPGESEKIELRVIPRARRLLIKSSGTLRLGESSLRNPSIPSAPQVPTQSKQPSTSNVAPDAPRILRPVDDGGIWYVQICAYNNLALAERRAAKLRDDGFASKIAPLHAKSSTVYQVRVGAFEDKRAASITALTLNQRYSSDTLVIAEKSPAINNIDILAQHLADTQSAISETIANNVQTSPHGEWYVQLAAYRLQTNVDRITSLLSKAGIHFILVPIAGTSETITQVRVGPFTTMLTSRTAASLFDSWLESTTLVIQSKSP